jgi:hypothetical protein
VCLDKISSDQDMNEAVRTKTMYVCTRIYVCICMYLLSSTYVCMQISRALQVAVNLLNILGTARQPGINKNIIGLFD